MYVCMYIYIYMYVCMYIYIYTYIHISYITEIMTNSASSFSNSFFGCIGLYFFCSLFMFSGKTNGCCEHFYNGELPSTTCRCFFVF